MLRRRLHYVLLVLLHFCQLCNANVQGYENSVLHKLLIYKKLEYSIQNTIPFKYILKISSLKCDPLIVCRFQVIFKSCTGGVAVSSNNILGQLVELHGKWHPLDFRPSNVWGLSSWTRDYLRYPHKHMQFH